MVAHTSERCVIGFGQGIALSGQRLSEFGPWLAYQLRRRGLTQAAFARRVPASTGSVSMWISGARQPDSASCDKIATALDMFADDVLAAAGHRDPPLDADSPVVQGLHAMMRRVELDQYRERILRDMMRVWLDQDRDSASRGAR